MNNTVIKIENLSKQYRLGVWGSSTIRDEVAKNWARILGKKDPTLAIGTENTLDTIDENYVWALRDINLEVRQGEVLGVIGKNGAGKSTLLKILSRVTSPTTGSIKIKGRIASLLEVGTGMHPEMTGRENIFLNGAILGMTKWEIKNKFDEIVDFAGIAKYVDTPIKRYSSGMRVRLGFAIAAFLDPEILIVDEVLAVGDAEFQNKAIGKMQDVSKGEGRTVLFVSHNMKSILQLCNKSILISKGKIECVDDTQKVIARYLKVSETVNTQIGNDECLEKLEFVDNQKKIRSRFFIGEEINIKLYYDTKNSIFDLIQIGITNSEGIRITTIGNHSATDIKKINGKGILNCKIANNILSIGKYYITVMFGTRNPWQNVKTYEHIPAFEILFDLNNKTENLKNGQGYFVLNSKWENLN